MARSISLEEAEGILGRLVRAVSSGDPLIITEAGRPVAALISAEALDPCGDGVQRSGMDAGLASLLGWEDPEAVLRMLEE